mmetsp:Transcript_15786/g.34415  ORF Transcript_15786/g.34415 Transcript_15786/m.34415 type:complete len:234 (+) Transcript_15786:1028-1729(+)
MNSGSRIAKHLLVDGKVDGIPNRNITCLGLLPKTINVGSNGLHLFWRNCSCIHGVSKCRNWLGVVVSIRGIRVLQFLGEFHRRHGRLICKLHGGLDISQDFLLRRLELILCEHTIGCVLLFKLLDRILINPCPSLLIFTATLVFRISRRVAVKSVSMNLENGRPFPAPDIVHHSLPPLCHISSILSINHETRYSVVLSLLVHFAIRSNIASESVDGTSIVNDNEEKGKIVLCS